MSRPYCSGSRRYNRQRGRSLVRCPDASMPHDHRNSRDQVRDGKREVDMTERNHELQGKRLRYIHVQRPAADMAGQGVEIVHEQSGIDRDHDCISPGENQHLSGEIPLISIPNWNTNKI